MHTIPSKLNAGIRALLEASEYAEDVLRDRWEFAVAIQHLEALGLTETDLRWLVRKEYVEHAREVTRLEDDGRDFRPTGDLSFCSRTCFVLTEVGVAKARSLSQASVTPSDATVNSGGHGQAVKRPVWDLNTRKLRINGQLVKHFRWPAPNQETVLTAFEEEGWPERIDDPLPPQPEQDSKRRLSDTVKCLNRRQMNAIVHFSGDGTGEGILWEFVDTPINGAD